MNSFVVHTEMTLDEMREMLKKENGYQVFRAEDAIFLISSPNSGEFVALMRDEHTDDDGIDLVPIVHNGADFSDVDNDNCPCCGEKMLPQEDYSIGYCNYCGFAWTESGMWFETTTV